MNYLDGFRGMFELVNGHAGIRVDHQQRALKEMNDFLVRVGVEAAEKLAGVPFPVELRPYLAVSSGTALHWWYEDGGVEQPGGEFDLVPLTTAWVKVGKTGIPGDYLGEGQRELLPHLTVINRRPRSGDGLMTVMDVRDGNTLYFHDIGKLLRMGIGYGKYLQCLLDLKGCGGWQLLYCEGDLAASIRFRLDFVERMMGYIVAMQGLFPDGKYDGYVARIQQLGVIY